MQLKQTARTRLFFARHGQTAQSRDDVFCGVTEVPLTERGREEAQLLAQRLRHESIDALYCSPEGRVQETVAPIRAELGLQPQTREALREMNFGLWEGRSRAELAHDYSQDLALWETGSWMLQVPQGELQQAVIVRAVACIIDLVQAHSGQTLLLVSHKTTIRLLIGHLLNMSLHDSRVMRLDEASLSLLTITGDQVELAFYNDTSHLQTK
jgi:broad specificity phosphatase PhoE